MTQTSKAFGLSSLLGPYNSINQNEISQRIPCDQLKLLWGMESLNIDVKQQNSRLFNLKLPFVCTSNHSLDTYGKCAADRTALKNRCIVLHLQIPLVEPHMVNQSNNCLVRPPFRLTGSDLLGLFCKLYGDKVWELKGLDNPCQSDIQPVEKVASIFKPPFLKKN